MLYQNYNVMNSTIQVRKQIQQANLFLRKENISEPIKRIITKQSFNRSKKQEKHLYTYIVEERQQRQHLQMEAKCNLFQQSQIRNHRDITKPYTNMQKTSTKKKLARQLQSITAFQDETQSSRKNNDQSGSKTIMKIVEKKQQKKSSFSNDNDSLNLQIYWKKRYHPQVTVLRPAILNPTITLQLNSELIGVNKSPSCTKYLQKKNIQNIFKEYARKTRQIYNTHDVSRYKSKQKSKIMSLSKRLVKLRSKSCQFIQQEYQKNKMIDQLQKLSSKRELNIQIKCLNSQKEMISQKKSYFDKSHKDLKEKIKYLIMKQIKAHSIDHLKQQNHQSTDHFDFKNSQNKKKKLQDIQNRSQSCFISAMKGPQNKKLKIANILNKFTIFKAVQIENRKAKTLQKQRSQKDKILDDLLKVKINEKYQQYKNESPIVKINHQCPDGNKNKLIQSIKNFCQQKSNNKLPFVCSLMKKSSSIHPENEAK